MAKEKTEDVISKIGVLFSNEFLLGRLLASNLLKSGICDTVQEGLSDLGLELETVVIYEVDPGLNNGGLGRLSTAFMVFKASLKISGSSMEICYNLRYLDEFNYEEVCYA